MRVAVFDIARNSCLSPNPVVYRRLGSFQAALPNIGRERKLRFGFLLQQMEDRGLEPLTFWLPARRSPN